MTKGLWLYGPDYGEDEESGVVVVVESCNDDGRVADDRHHRDQRLWHRPFPPRRG